MPRYFLMRCAEARIVERAVQKGLWPVSHGCQDRLNDAFASGESQLHCLDAKGVMVSAETAF